MRLRGRFVDEASARIDVRISATLMERVLGMRLEQRRNRWAPSPPTCGFEQVRDFIASGTVTALIDLPFALLFVIVIAWIALAGAARGGGRRAGAADGLGAAAPAARTLADSIWRAGAAQRHAGGEPDRHRDHQGAGRRSVVQALGARQRLPRRHRREDARRLVDRDVPHRLPSRRRPRWPSSSSACT